MKRGKKRPKAKIFEHIAILVVHEDEQIRRTFVQRYRLAGFSALDAENEEQALHMVRLGIVDVIVAPLDGRQDGCKG